MSHQSPRRHHHISASRTPSVASTAALDECVNPKEINTSMRLEKVRKLMEELSLGIYVIASEDAHQSEYTSPVDQRRAFISGFSGSAGVAIITRELTSQNETPEGLAILATDGRYFTQAADELDFNWNLHKLNTPGVPSWEKWLVDHAAILSLDSGETVQIGIDPQLITYENVKSIQSLIDAKIADNSKCKIKIVPVRENLVDKIWDDFEVKPEREFKPIFKLDDKYTGEDSKSKLERLKKDYLEKHGSNVLILSGLDEIAWLLNLRGSDIEYNPLFYSYLIVNGDKLTLYTDDKIRFTAALDGTLDNSNALTKYLKGINCDVKNYSEIWFDIRKLATALNAQAEKILLTKEASWKIVNCIIAGNFHIISSPIKEMKEIKNDVELLNQKKAQIDDGFALIRYFSWLERELTVSCEFISEYEAAMKLLEFRSSLADFRGLSFETISSSGANAAIIHYSPPVTGSAIINPEKIYLCDSGSQFLHGTTDTTRTVHFGTPTEREILAYTLVLKGHIALATMTIPSNRVTGYQIDCIARQFLWQHGLDYQHGTGHGVDAFGPVHSAGVGIGFRPYCNENTVKRGHLISNEPGYYEVGEFGIRIENMFYVKDATKPNSNEILDGWLQFETTTRVPYCRKLIDVNMLTAEEKSWINEYHQGIWELYEKKLSDTERIWLRRETASL